MVMLQQRYSSKHIFWNITCILSLFLICWLQRTSTKTLKIIVRDVQCTSFCESDGVDNNKKRNSNGARSYKVTLDRNVTVIPNIAKYSQFSRINGQKRKEFTHRIDASLSTSDWLDLATLEKRREAFVFVHIGKTGGSTSRCMLPERIRSEDCNSQSITPRAQGLLKQIIQIAPFINATIASCHMWSCEFVTNARSNRRGASNNDTSQSLYWNLYRQYRNRNPKDMSSLWVNHNNPFRGAIVSVRNPVERMISWFYYERNLIQPKYGKYRRHASLQKNENLSYLFYLKCYTEMSDVLADLSDYFVMKNSNGNSSNSSSSVLIQYRSAQARKRRCQKAAYRCLAGKSFCMFHNKYNYRYYLQEYLKYFYKTKTNSSYGSTESEQIPRKPKLYIIRNEYKWHDWVSFNEITTLEQSPTFGVVVESDRKNESKNKTNPINNQTKYEQSWLISTTSAKMLKLASDTIYSFGNETGALRKTDNNKGSRNITQEHRRVLCRILCDEINIYKFILQESENLSPKDIQLSFDELNESCGSLETAVLCPFNA